MSFFSKLFGNGNEKKEQIIPEEKEKTYSPKNPPMPENGIQFDFMLEKRDTRYTIGMIVYTYWYPDTPDANKVILGTLRDYRVRNSSIVHAPTKFREAGFHLEAERIYNSNYKEPKSRFLPNKGSYKSHLTRNSKFLLKETIYHNNGNISSYKEYNNGKLSGKVKDFDENGELLETKFYARGVELNTQKRMLDDKVESEFRNFFTFRRANSLDV